MKTNAPAKRTVLAVVAAGLALLPFNRADAEPLRSADSSLERIMAVLNRPARSAGQHAQNIATALTMLDRFEWEYREPVHRATAAFVRAQCYVGLEDYPRALAEIDTALSLPLRATYAPVAGYLRGRILVSLDRYDEGAAVLRRVLATSPRHEVVPEVRLTLAQTLADRGMGGAAAALLDTVVRQGEPAWAVQAARARAMIPTVRMIGEQAPGFDVDAFDGRRISLGLYRGRVVLIDFWATWCAPCRIAMPDVVRLYRRYHERGFDIVGISLDHNAADLRDYLRRQNIPWRQVLDSRAWDSPLAQRYQVTGIPKTFLLDRDGRISAVDLRGERLEVAIERLLGQP